jgi:LuxR family maltose regulon positive regulatory protein
MLLRRLDEGLAYNLVLISAPAGFGKTTLLSEWAHQVAAPQAQAAWFSLDEADNDPARFTAYLVAALHAALEPAGQDALEELGTSKAPSQEEILTGLINKVAAIPRQLALVLDDYHLITAQAVHDAMVFLLDHLPENLCLVIASRSDPPLPLPRLRARGHLLELRQADLRLTPEETAAFLNQVMGLGLSPEDVTALEARTEGWVAGLQMAALAMRGIAARGAPGEAGRSEFVRAFTGSHRFILDYLMEEVLEQESPEIQEFLLTTSILNRLSGPLCDRVRFGAAETARFGEAETPSSPAGSAVRFGRAKAPSSSPGTSMRFGTTEPLRFGEAETLDRTGSRSILQSLDAANLFIVPLDDERRWYRYHRLFSDLLRKRLRQTHPELLPVLHRRASEWHEGQGMVAPAIDHALAAEDFERAADLIEDSVEATFMRSEVVTFLNWMERLPDEWARTRPTLCFYHAWALLMSGGSLEVAERRLQDVACLQEAAGGEDLMPGRMAALRAYTALFQADTARTTELCREALETLPESDLFLRSIVGWLLSLTALYDGDLEDAEQALEDLARKGQEVGNPLTAVTALCYQARLQVRAGHLHRAEEILERALQLATDRQGRRLPIASEPLIGLGDLWGEWNDLEIAEAYLLESIELALQWSELASFDAYIPLVRIRAARGDMEGASQALETARQLALRSDMTEVDDVVVDLQGAYFLVTQGDLEGATRWAEGRGLLPGATEGIEPVPGEDLDLLRERMQKYEHIVLARLLVALNRAAEALDLLEPLLELARQRDRVDLIIEVQILRALAWRMEGDDDRVMEALGEALTRAEPGGWVLTFLDEGPVMAGLLRRAASLGVSPAYVASLLAAFDAAEPGEGAVGPLARPAQPLAEPLSERELEVLRLLSAGLSNPEIAEQLYIAVSTVRSHCKSIYGKLNVHKRWDAVHRAQELGLL